MKRFLWLMLLSFPVTLFAQQNKEEEEAIIYDTVSVHDPKSYNLEEMRIYNKNSGNLYRAGHLLNGKKDGIWRTYYENGMLSRVEEYNIDQLNGMVLIFETNGMIQKEQYMKNGVLDGELHDYSRGGMMKTDERYKNGLLNGWRRVFAQDGTMQEEGGWKNGKRDSINRWSYPGGTMYVEYTYKGESYRSRLAYDPGNRLRVRVSVTPDEGP